MNAIFATAALWAAIRLLRRRLAPRRPIPPEESA